MLLLRKIPNIRVSPARNYQVTVLGAASEVGQSIGLLLRSQPLITKLVMHDSLQETPGVLLDLSHIPSDSSLAGFSGDYTMDKALKNSDIVILTGGVIVQPGMTKRSCFSLNTAFIKKAAARVARLEPMPFVGIVTEPINSMVPMTAEVMRNHGDFDGKKLFGITTIDLLRAQCLFAAENQLNPRECFVPVIGGHSKKTTIPLISHATPRVNMDEKTIQEFTSLVRKSDNMITRAKRGWSPTVSVAYSVLIFVRGILDALQGNQARVQAYIENNDFGTSYFSGLVNVSQHGACEMQTYNHLSQYECHLLEESINQLRRDVNKGKKILEYA